jgi:hypothetical protein
MTKVNVRISKNELHLKSVVETLDERFPTEGESNFTSLLISPVNPDGGRRHSHPPHPHQNRTSVAENCTTAINIKTVDERAVSPARKRKTTASSATGSSWSITHTATMRSSNG